MADNKSILVGQASQLELNNVYEETQRFREKCTFENQAFFNDKVKFDDRVDFNYNTYMHEKMSVLAESVFEGLASFRGGIKSTGNDTFSGIVEFNRPIDPPFKVRSKALVENLNADLVGGVEGKTLKDHLGNYNNPHRLTKTSVGLGLVENFGIATEEEARQGNASDKYVTVQRARQIAEKFGMNGQDGSAFAKLNDENNFLDRNAFGDRVTFNDRAVFNDRAQFNGVVNFDAGNDPGYVGDWDADDINSQQAPFNVNSSGLVGNLNANYLEGRSYGTLMTEVASMIAAQKPNTGYGEALAFKLPDEKGVIRTVVLSASEPDPNFGNDGDIWIQYT